MVDREESIRFLKNFMTIGMGTLIYMIVGVIGTPILTRLVDPAAYGRMSLLTVYSSMGMTLCGLGLDQALMRYFYREKDVSYQRTLVQACCRLPVMSALIAGALLLPALPGLTRFSLTDACLLAASVVALLVHRISVLLLRLRHRAGAYAAVNLISKAAYIGISVLLVLLPGTQHYEMLAIATILSTLLAAAAAMLCERSLWQRPKRGYVFPIRQRELLRYGAPFILSCGITTIFSALDRLFIERYCSMRDVGVYAGAMNLIAVFSIVRTAFNAIWLPSAVEHYEKNPTDRRFYQQGNAFISIVMLLLGALVVLSKDAIVLLLGDSYQEAAKLLPYLMFEPIMYTISETTVTGLVVQNKSSHQVLVAAGACAVNLCGNRLLTPLMGPRGAALSTGISYIVFFALRTALANRVYPVRYGLPRFAAAAAALLAFSVYGSSHSFSGEQLLMFLGVAAVIAAAYRKELSVFIRYALKTARRLSP